MERKPCTSGAGSAATGRGTARSINLPVEAYQAIRAAVAEEVAMNSHSFATERGAVTRQSTGERRAWSTSTIPWNNRSKLNFHEHF